MINVHGLRRHGSQFSKGLKFLYVLVEGSLQFVKVGLVGHDPILDHLQGSVHASVVPADVGVEVLLKFADATLAPCKFNLCSSRIVRSLFFYLPAEESEVVLQYLYLAGQVLHHTFHQLDLVNRGLRYHNGVGRFVVGIGWLAMA